MREPTDAQAVRARSRVLDYDAVQSLIYAVLSSIGESVRQSGSERLANGGALRSVPLDDEGLYEFGSERQKAFSADSSKLNHDAAAMNDTMLDWSECDAFKDVR